jgi:hypothetical protein
MQQSSFQRKINKPSYMHHPWAWEKKGDLRRNSGGRSHRRRRSLSLFPKPTAAIAATHTPFLMEKTEPNQPACHLPWALSEKWVRRKRENQKHGRKRSLKGRLDNMRGNKEIE